MNLYPAPILHGLHALDVMCCVMCLALQEMPLRLFACSQGCYQLV